MMIARAEVGLVNLDPTIADEIRKTRPAVVVNNDAVGILDLRIIVPITMWQPRFDELEWLVRLEPDSTNGLDKSSSADTFQVRSISSQRFVGGWGAYRTLMLAGLCRDFNSSWTSIECTHRCNLTSTTDL